MAGDRDAGAAEGARDDGTAEETLAATGAELAVQVTQALSGWVVRCVVTVFDAWTETSGDAAEPTHREQVVADAEASAGRAALEVGERLRGLLAADVDAQRATPLELVRQAVRYPTGVLRAAGVPPIQRDRFATERFPDDDYGLTPASLASLDPSLGDVAVQWGAAKAAAHRRRHR